MNQIIRTMNRNPRQRTTSYSDVNPERIAAGLRQIDLVQIINTPAKKYERKRSRADLIRNEPLASKPEPARPSGTSGA
jgi:FO synthase